MLYLIYFVLEMRILREWVCGRGYICVVWLRRGYGYLEKSVDVSAGR
jgi:hypothetical protein